MFHGPPEAMECSVPLGGPVSLSCLRLLRMRDCCMRKNVHKAAWLPQPDERQLPGRCEAGQECLGGLGCFWVMELSGVGTCSADICGIVWMFCLSLFLP